MLKTLSMVAIGETELALLKRIRETDQDIVQPTADVLDSYEKLSAAGYLDEVSPRTYRLSELAHEYLEMLLGPI